MDCPIHKGYFLDRNEVGDRGFCGQCKKWYDISSNEFDWRKLLKELI